MEVNEVYNGNCLEVLKTFPDNSIDSVVTDPPYGISFMNKHWDYDVPKVEVWKEIYRLLKPGAHVLCACGTRTQHRMAVNIEDAGFEIRDVITWHYGSGFPKSLDISKAIDKQAGVEREVVGEKVRGDVQAAKANGVTMAAADANKNNSAIFGYGVEKLTIPSTDEAKEWEGWGTALKPATEFWTLARKPLSEKTVAENVLKYGTGGINIDGSRVETSEVKENDSQFNAGFWQKSGMKGERWSGDGTNNPLGRFPANVIFDEFTGKILDEQTGILTSGTGAIRKNAEGLFGLGGDGMANVEYGDSGGASRFFYCPKADNYERNKGLKGFDGKQTNDGREKDIDNAFQRGTSVRQNHHPTVKPIDLMRYLVKLITQKRGICLDPYCGSGTTLIGCKMELINYIGIEREEEYCKIAEARVAAWNPERFIEQKLF